MILISLVMDFAKAVESCVLTTIESKGDDKTLLELLFNKFSLPELNDLIIDTEWPQNYQQFLTDLQVMLEEYYDSTDSANQSSKGFIRYIKTQDIDLSKTSYLDSLSLKPKQSSQKSKKRQLPKDLTIRGQSSGIQNKKVKDIATSSIDAYITPVTAAVQHYEDSDSNDEGLATLLNSVKHTQPTSGKISSSIFYKNQGVSYTWKSEAWTTASKYVDLKIYNNPAVLMEKKPMEQWKEAGLRAKVLIGTESSLLSRTQRIESCLKRLTELLIAEVANQPDCQSYQKE